jgi:SNF2 family DNA or RNA helicase
MSRKEEADRSKIRVGVMHGKILPHFQIRRDKRLIKDEVSVYQTGLTVKLPVKHDLVIFCPLKPRQIAAYQALIDSDGM